MKGVTFRPASTMSIFIKNVLIYGVGGVIVPFAGIKLIDLLITVI
jgi:K+-transporting ATPase ATPase B chain